jgi:aldose 1-epimerase
LTSRGWRTIISPDNVVRRSLESDAAAERSSRVSDWRVERFDWFGENALRVVGGAGATCATVALSGATLLGWQVHDDGELLELTDGYRNAAELREQSGVRNGVLAPFPNRIADGRYRFGGQEHDLLPGIQGDRTVYHGFARVLPFSLVEATTSADAARIVLRSNELRPGRFNGYPFALDLAVVYVIGETQIQLEIEAVNVGDTAAPYAAGWHPYFRLPNGTDEVDDLELSIPAGTLIRTDAALIPVAGPGSRRELDGLPEMDFRHGVALGRRVIDACYGELRFGPDGRAETALREPKTGRELRVWQESGFMHVFTGDTLPRDRRRSVAIEPVEVMTNAYNRAEFASAITLAPGERRSFRCGVRFISRFSSPE